MENLKGKYNIAVAGTGYVGLSLAVCGIHMGLLSLAG